MVRVEPSNESSDDPAERRALFESALTARAQGQPHVPRRMRDAYVAPPTIGLFSLVPPSDLLNVAEPNTNTPPSLATRR